MNQAVIQLFKSLSITVAVALGIALVAFLFTNNLSVFFGVFIASFILQFIIHYFWQTFLINRLSISENEVLQSYITQNTKQSINLNCAYCQAQNNVNIDINSENIFGCKNCNQQNIIMMEFSTARVTVAQDTSQVLNTINTIINSDENAATVKVNNLSKPIEFK